MFRFGLVGFLCGPARLEGLVSVVGGAGAEVRVDTERLRQFDEGRRWSGGDEGRSTDLCSSPAFVDARKQLFA